jgi:hypothetical protein
MTSLDAVQLEPLAELGKWFGVPNTGGAMTVPAFAETLATDRLQVQR